MKPTFPIMRPLAAIVLALSSVTACGDDDPTSPLAVPTNVTATELANGDVQVTWNQVPSADAYRVERAEGDSPFAELESSVAATVFTDQTTESDVEYSYRVFAVRGTTVSGASAEATLTTGAAVAILEGFIDEDRTLYADSLYVLHGYVKVTNQSTLTIEPGTRIVGDYDEAGSSLWVLRGSKIMAVGTADAPIVFTSERPEGQRNAGDWGGVVIVGNGVINRSGTILTEGPVDQSVNYGQGTDNGDSSGRLEYVRIEFAGYDLSGGQGQELNTLSSYAVGGGTVYDHVQAAYGLDDAFEWWGGAVDGRYLVSYETGDDHFDASEGYVGRNQYLIALQTTKATPEPGRGGAGSDPRGFEIDGCDTGAGGCTAGFSSTPYTMPVFANYTIIGPGTTVFSTNDGNGMVVRRGAGGTYVNGVIGRWPGYGLSVRDAEAEALRLVDSLIIRNTVFAENDRGAFEPADVAAKRYAANFGDAAYQNVTAADVEALFVGLPAPAMAPTTASLDWTPAAGSALTTAGISTFPAAIQARVQNYFGTTAMTATPFAGAADPTGPKWWEGWTNYARN